MDESRTRSKATRGGVAWEAVPGGGTEDETRAQGRSGDRLGLFRGALGGFDYVVWYTGLHCLLV